jgi:putative DNA primase/helicase
MTENQFKAALIQGGIYFDAPIIPDDQIHRAKGAGHRAGTKNIAYRFDGKMGWAQDFKTNAFIKWSVHGGKFQLSAAELEQIRQAKEQRQKEIETQYQRDAILSRKQWDELEFANSSNPYCKRKRIQPHGCKTGTHIPRQKETGKLFHQYSVKNCLVVPMYNAAGELMNLQFISPTKPANDRPDKNNNRGQKQGCYFPIGEPTDTILICEGFSTGASLFEHYGLYTLVSFGKGNLAPVARITRAAYPNHEIVIAGDNDIDGGGQAAATAAALSIGGKIMIPPTTGFDWNDELNANKKGAL